MIQKILQFRVKISPSDFLQKTSIQKIQGMIQLAIPNLKTSFLLFTFAPCISLGVSEKIKFGYFSKQSKDYFQTIVLPQFEKTLKNHKNYELIDLSVYNEQGLPDPTQVEKTLSQTESTFQVLLFDFNWVSNKETQNLEDSLQKKIKDGTLIIANTGKKPSTGNLSPLSRTVFGKYPEVIIIGERDKRDRIPNDSYFGPEMLTAVRIPPEHEGKDIGVVLFGAKLAQNWNRKKNEEWGAYFKEKKEKNKRLWLDLENLFPW